jgi:hypothetical protein
MYDFALTVYESGAQVWASDCDHNLEAACSGILAGAAKGGPHKLYRARQVKLLLSQPCLKTLALQRYGANVQLRRVAYSSHLPHFLPHWVSSVTRCALGELRCGACGQYSVSILCEVVFLGHARSKKHITYTNCMSENHSSSSSPLRQHGCTRAENYSQQRLRAPF